MYSQSINNLIAVLKKLPSVGERTAERYVFHWLKSGKGEVASLREALDTLLKNTKSCESCFDFTDRSPCHICADKRRDQQLVCVVAEPQDIQTLEKTGAFTGRYHVLRGLLGGDADSEDLNNLKIKELLTRIKKEPIKEIILALNPDLSGETTSLYLQQTIKKINPKILVTRLARGLPMGSDLQYADEITLSSAIKNRK